MPTNMDLLNVWGSMGDMTTLQQRAGGFGAEAEPLQVRAACLPRACAHVGGLSLFMCALEEPLMQICLDRCPLPLSQRRVYQTTQAHFGLL